MSEGNYWTTAIKISKAFCVAFAKADGFVALQHAVQSDDKTGSHFYYYFTFDLRSNYLSEWKAFLF